MTKSMLSILESIKAQSSTQMTVLQLREFPFQHYFVNTLKHQFQNKKQLQICIKKRTNPRSLPCTNPDAIESTENIYRQIDQLVSANAESPLEIE